MGHSGRSNAYVFVLVKTKNSGFEISVLVREVMGAGNGLTKLSQYFFVIFFEVGFVHQVSVGDVFEGVEFFNLLIFPIRLVFFGLLAFVFFIVLF